MRQIANAVKQCPAQKTLISQNDQCQVGSYYSGPSDVLLSKTGRSPFQGIFEFTLPSYSTYVDRTDLSARDHQNCVDKAARLAKMGLRPLPAKSATVEGHRRYEFDFGSGAPELVKMLEVSKDKDNKTVTSAATEEGNACWVTTAKAGGANQG